MDTPPSTVLHSRINSKIVIASLLAVVVVVVAARYNTTQAPPVQHELTVSSSAQNVDLNADPDNDGLKNWEEDLWGTDKTKADTDGDGVSDGTEVHTGHNPLKPGPDDKIQKGDFQSISKQSGEYFYDDDPSLNVTEVVARDIFSTYVAMKQNGEIDTAVLANLVRATKDKVDTRAVPFETRFTAKDLTLSADGVEALKTYGNTLGSIFLQTATQNKGKPTELAVLHDALQQQKAERLKDLVPYAASYEALIASLVAVHVPPSLAKRHLALLNSYDLIRQSVVRMETLFDDPMLNTKALSTYDENAINVSRIAQDIRAALKTAGVVFVSGDPGFAFFESK